MVLTPCGQGGAQGRPGGHEGQTGGHEGPRRDRKVLGGRYTLVGALGRGTYGKVHKGVERLTGRQVAIKTIRKDKVPGEDGIARIRREIRLMATLRHLHIIAVYEVMESRERLVLVLELASRGELYDLVSQRPSLPECEARRLFRQIVSALLYCHQNGIVHRDLKLENILLDENYNVKLADFGLSSEFGNGRLLSTFCGSPLYASPEIVNGTAYLGPEVDSWALGVLLYILVYGSMPFHGRHLKALTRHISRGEYAEPARPSDACGLIRWLLMVNPARRASVRDAAAHWWVNWGYAVPLSAACSEPPTAALAPSTLTRWLSDGDLGEMLHRDPSGPGDPRDHKDLRESDVVADPQLLVGGDGSPVLASPIPHQRWSDDATATVAPRPLMQWISHEDLSEIPQRDPGDPNVAPGREPFIRDDDTSTLALSAQQWLHSDIASTISTTSTTATIIITQRHFGPSLVGYEEQQPPKGILKNHRGLLPDSEPPEDPAWTSMTPTTGETMDCRARWWGVSARALDGAGTVPRWRTRGSSHAAPRRADGLEGSRSSLPSLAPALPPPPRGILKVNGKCSTSQDWPQEYQ